MHSAFDLFNIPTNLTDFQKIVLTGLSGLATAVFIYWLNRRATKKSALKQAIDEFKAAFTDEVIKLDRQFQSIEADRAIIIVRNAATKHRNAWLKLQRHLSKSQRAEFDIIWKEYEGESKYDGVHNVAIAKRQLALDRIKKLIEFADNLKP